MSYDLYFSYPLEGVPALTVHLVRSPDGTTVDIRVEGDVEPLLAGRIRRLLDVW